ncbi:MAG: Ig-like domain-containing protein [Balneolales bacterium]|nr:Ig-like domain-containing protein [Balneolales bacterium]
MKRIALLLIWIGSMAIPGLAHSPSLEILSNTGFVGDTINVPVTITMEPDTPDIQSFEIELTLSNNVEIIGVRSEGTATGDWGDPSGNYIATNRYRIAGAGSQPITQSDTLFFLRVTSENTASVFASLQSALFNEDLVADDFTNGTVQFVSRPVYSISPTSADLVRGDSLQMNIASGAVRPIEWSTNRPDLAEISEDGMLLALDAGDVTVIATDAEGTVSTSSGYRIYPFELSIREVEQFEGLDLIIDLDVAQMSDLQVKSGSFTLSLNYFGNNVTNVTAETDETLLEGGTVTINHDENDIRVSFAMVDPVEDDGHLLRLVLETSQDGTVNTMLSADDVVFNTDLVPLGVSGRVRVVSLPLITLDPFGSITLLAGDSLQYTAGNTSGEVTWESLDTSIGEIDENGLFIARKGGEVRITATDEIGANRSSGIIRVYDFELGVQTTSVLTGTRALVPVRITNTELLDEDLLSFEVRLSFANSFVNPEIETAGSLTENWSVSTRMSGSTMRIALAGSEPLPSDGILFYIAEEIPAGESSSNRSITLQEAIANEGTPVILLENGSMQVRTELTRPTLLSPNNNVTIEDTLITHSWNSVEAASFYRFQLATDNDFEAADMLKDSLTTEIELAVDGLPNNEAYYWRVRAESQNAEVLSPWSAVRNYSTDYAEEPVDPDPVAPGVPILLEPEDGETDVPVQPIFVWSTSENAETYLIQVSESDDFSSFVFDEDADADTTWTPVSDLDFNTTYFWRVQAVSSDSTSGWSDASSFTTVIDVSIHDDTEEIPVSVTLDQNYPNPFNPTTTIPFSLPEAAHVRIEVFNALGEMVSVLVNENRSAGSHSIVFNAEALSSGVYIYRLTAGNTTKTRQFTLVK